MLRRHAKQRGSEGGNGRTPVPAPSKGGQMGTKHGKKRRFRLNRVGPPATMADRGSTTGKCRLRCDRYDCACNCAGEDRNLGLSARYACGHSCSP